MLSVRVLMVALSCVMLLGACGPKKAVTQEKKTVKEAKEDCFQQAQSMYNNTINPASASSNDYFVMCMQSQYGYTLEQINNTDNISVKNYETSSN